MGKSVFLMPSKNKMFNRTQLRKIRDEIKNGLLLEGPFSDWNGAVKDLAEQIKSRIKFGHTDIANEVFSSLVPQNLPKCAKRESRLSVPFLFGNNTSDPFSSKHCSGEIASSPTIDYNDGLVRVADYDELTLLSVSVLRSIDIECYYTILHFEGSSLQKLIGIPETDPHLLKRPCVVIPRNGTLSLGVLYPPFYHEPISSMEVLDTDAIASLIFLKQAKASALSLMDDMDRREPDFPNEGEMRSIQIGHTIFEGEKLWTPEDLEWSLSLASSMFSAEFVSCLESMRDVVEKEYSHMIRCPTCHSSIAAEKLLCAQAKREIKEGINELVDTVDLFKALALLNNHECENRYKRYMQFALAMNEHIHSPSECTSERDAN
jgi:hypothetical protein